MKRLRILWVLFVAVLGAAAGAAVAWFFGTAQRSTALEQAREKRKARAAAAREHAQELERTFGEAAEAAAEVNTADMSLEEVTAEIERIRRRQRAR